MCQWLHIEKSTQFYQLGMANPLFIEAATAWCTMMKGTFPEDDPSMRSDVRVELSTVSHSVHTVSIAATRPSRWSAIRITKDAAPHSRHLRPLTSVDSMLDRVMTVVMSPALSGASSRSLPSSLKVVMLPTLMAGGSVTC